MLRADVTATPGGRYAHWDRLQRLEPPVGLTSEEWWAAIKFARSRQSKALPLVDRNGHPFTLAYVDPVLQKLHVIDQRASGRLGAPEVIMDPGTRDRYVVSSLIEEAITSSQLEGASTTRRVAREMLRTGRSPRTKAERMIVNNYLAMEFVRTRVDRDLDVAMLLELQAILTDGTIDQDFVGRFQRPDEDRVGVYDELGSLLHDPPPAHDIPHRMSALCEFANAHAPEGEFLHPVARAVLLHFMLGYEHPFEDGNGRTARAVFYWAMLKQGYWLAEFLSISSLLVKAPSRYARSFLYTERDDNDATYFVLFQLDIVVRAIDALDGYLKRKFKEVRDTERLLRASDFNNRQIALLSHALRHSGATYTFQSHARSHRCVYQSARTDLLDLERRGLLVKSTRRRQFVFSPAPDLDGRLRST